MATARPPPYLFDLDITVVSAKHLKNVNWRNGDLKPYAVFWVDPDHRHATKSDESGSTRPVWNEHFVFPLTLPLADSFLTLEIFHSKPSEAPKPLVGTLRVALKDLTHPDDPTRIRTFELRRPSGRPQGKIHVKLATRDRSPPPPPDYHFTPPPSYYYSTAPPPPRDYRGYSPSSFTTSLPPPPPPSASSSLSPAPAHTYPYGSYSDPYLGYYSGYYPAQPPPPPRPFFDRTSTTYGGPSAPVDYTPYDQKQKSGKAGGFGAGLAVGTVAGALGGMSLEEGLKREEEKTADRVESDLASRAAGYSDYRVDYGYN